MKILIVGDTHGNVDWLRGYIYPVAMTLKADAVVVLGDFGAWEHTPAGGQFMDEVGRLSEASGVPLYWLHGNHDNHAHTLKHYGDRVDQRGFIICRDLVFYIPQGHRWTWGGVTFRAFGGAYSVDKDWRLKYEDKRYAALLREARLTKSLTAVPSQEGTLWFPDEEMTDAAMTALLELDSSPKDVILSHDKPYSSKPDWNRKLILGCVPNQMRMERALRAHRPAWWLHGHLHYHYVDKVFGDDWSTTVVGLEPDDHADEPGWKRTHTWVLAEAENNTISIKLGKQVFVDSELLQDAMGGL